jgi:hypothetical protein
MKIMQESFKEFCENLGKRIVMRIVNENDKWLLRKFSSKYIEYMIPLWHKIAMICKMYNNEKVCHDS